MHHMPSSNDSLRQAIRYFFAADVDAPGTRDGETVYQILESVRNELSLDSVDEWRKTSTDPAIIDQVNTARKQLNNMMNIGLRIVATARKDEELLNMLGPVEATAFLGFKKMPGILESIKNVLANMPLQCHPDREASVKHDRTHLIAALGNIEQLYDQTVEQTLRNKKNDRSEDQGIQGPGS